MKGDPIAEGFAALALDRRLVAGQPYPAELAALEKLGAPPDAFAALKPYAATGAPTPRALGGRFRQTRAGPRRARQGAPSIPIMRERCGTR